MKRIDELFVVHRARSRLFRDYEVGKVPYVGNSMSNNAVIGFVMPLPNDKVFNFRGIAMSAFCEATVQTASICGLWSCWKWLGRARTASAYEAQ